LNTGLKTTMLDVLIPYAVRVDDGAPFKYHGMTAADGNLQSQQVEKITCTQHV
jgi:hypothetical protein